MLDPQHLRSFQEIARTGSYSAAARRLGYTQPALSYQMRLLERALGAPLTARAGRRITLTPAGQALLRHAEQILTAIRVAERDLAHVVGAPAGLLRVVSFSSGRATIVADAVADVVAAHPALDVRLIHADPLEATAMVVRGDADLAVTYRYAVEELPGLSAEIRGDNTSSPRRSPLTSVGLLTDQVRLLLPAGHRLAGATVDSLLPFADERFLVGSELFAGLLRRSAAAAGFVPHLIEVADDCASMQALVARGVGLALLPALELMAVGRDDVVHLPLTDWPTRQVAVESWPDLLRLPSVEPFVAALGAAARRAVVDAGDDTIAVAADVAPTGTGVRRRPPERQRSWSRSFDQVTTTMPRRARSEADHGVVISDVSGTQQAHRYTTAGLGPALTAVDGGVALADIDPRGDRVWWFADDHGDEFGVWMVQPVDGGAAVAASPDVAPGWPCGLALTPGRAALGRSVHGAVELYVVDDPGGRAATTLVYSSEHYAAVGALSADGSLLAISHSEDGNSLKPALRVLGLARVGRDDNADVVAELDDGPGLGLRPVAFSPIVGNDVLLVAHERGGLARPLLWHVGSGAVVEVDPRLPGETTASWYPDGDALLLVHHYRGRSELYRVELGEQTTVALPTPRGSIAEAAVRPDGTVEYVWSSATSPPRLLTVGDDVTTAASGAALDAITVSGAGGDIPVLLARPESAGSAPLPTVLLVHGGPGAHDADAFSAARNAWVDSGFVAVHVNYRGSTGYGTTWRNGNLDRPGRTELEDLVAVRDALVADGTADPDRIVVAGRSWGGYLTLLALGHHPSLWSLGVAIVPVADTAAVYEDMMEQLRASYRVRFGGPPSQRPDAYREASPLDVIDDVAVPVLITGGLHDARCPIRQIELYTARLDELGKPYELHTARRGHDARSVAERIEEMDAVLAFVDRHLPAD